jgi:hypothetical protein
MTKKERLLIKKAIDHLMSDDEFEYAMDILYKLVNNGELSHAREIMKETRSIDIRRV